MTVIPSDLPAPAVLLEEAFQTKDPLKAFLAFSQDEVRRIAETDDQFDASIYAEAILLVEKRLPELMGRRRKG
ncbi:MAG: hypothetical protein HQL56_07135 [Magnetococcales bacterium]|nr:hypothetical protein [Magnetococcales bacterium]